MIWNSFKSKFFEYLFPKVFDGKQWRYTYDGIVFAIVSYFITLFLFSLELFTSFDESFNAFMMHVDYVLNFNKIGSSKQIILVKKDENTCSTIGRAVNRKDFASVVRFLGSKKDVLFQASSEKGTYISNVNIIRLKFGLLSKPVIFSLLEIYNNVISKTKDLKLDKESVSKRTFFSFEENLIRSRYGGVLKSLKFPDFTEIIKFIKKTYKPEELLVFGNKLITGLENLINSKLFFEFSFLPSLRLETKDKTVTSNHNGEKVLFELGLFLSRKLPKKSILPPACIIAFDFVLDGEKTKEEDEILRNAIEQANSTIVLGALSTKSYQNLYMYDYDENYKKTVTVATIVEQINTILPYYQFIATNTRVAAINAAQSSKGYVSKIPMIVKTANGKLMPSFSLLLAMLYLDKINKLTGSDSYEINLYKELERIQQELNSGTYEGGIKIKDIAIPTDKYGYMTVRFWGSTVWPNGMPYFKSVSMYECFDEKHLIELAGSNNKNVKIEKLIPQVAHKKTKQPLIEYDNTIFIIAPFEITDFDFYPTPFTSYSPYTPQSQHLMGAEIHANALQTILNRCFLYNFSKFKLFLSLIIFALISGIIFQKTSPYVGFAVLVIIEFLSFVMFYYMYKMNYLLHVTPVIIIFPLIWALTNISHYIKQRKLAQSTKEMFGRFVSPEVVDYLIKNPNLVKPGGEKVELTIFFSDLAGFTTISESLKPEDLVVMMNEYLGEMTELLFKHGGTLDKYIGDAIMAFWNYPKHQPDHAVRALMYTLEMHEKLKKLQAEWIARGLPKAYARAGINTANVVVGCIGSKTQMNFTCLGDGVNLASRLEGANKEYGTLYMCSESTYSKAKHAIRFRFLDFLAVKGKKEPVKVYEIVSIIGNEPQWYLDIASKYEEAIQLHLNRKWDEAIRIFEEIIAKYPNDGPSKTYLRRCLEYKENPPPENWDGSYHLTHK